MLVYHRDDAAEVGPFPSVIMKQVFEDKLSLFSNQNQGPKPKQRHRNLFIVLQ